LKGKIMARKQTQKSTGNGNDRTEVFSFHSPEATKVQLVGEFTQWEQRPINLQKGDDGTWKATVILPPGTHQYKFVVDGNWCDDPACTQRAPNPFGGENMMRQVA
jgi:1,4-alpha-glucan branching enzyme